MTVPHYTPQQPRRLLTDDDLPFAAAAGLPAPDVAPQEMFPPHADPSFCLYGILASTSREFFLIDVRSFHFITASASALENLDISLAELRALRVCDVFSDVSHEFLAGRLTVHSRQPATVVELISQQVMINHLDISLKLVYVKEGGKELLIAIRGGDHEALVNTEHIHRIVSAIPSVVFKITLAHDNQISFNFLSEGCEALLGVSCGTFLMRPDKFIELIRPEERLSFIRSMKRSARKQTPWSWEGGLRTANGIKLLHLRAAIGHDDQGDVSWHGVITDVSVDKNETQQLNRIISRYKAIVSSIPSLVFEATLNDDDKLEFSYLNEGCQSLLEIAPDALIQDASRLLEMILPDDRASFLRSMRQSAATMEVWNWEGGLWMEKWQDVKSVNLRATASRNLRGRIQWGGVITNITQSKNERMALDEITNRFKAIVSNIPSLVFQCFLTGEDRLAFNYLSDGCQALLGISADTLFTQPERLLDIILPEDRASFLRTMRQSAQHLTVWNWEGGLWIEQWQDVKLVNLRASAMVNAQGQVQWGGVITNITQSKKEKLEIERSHQQLEELSAHMALVKEQERLRIAREIHDNLGGNLTTIKIGLSSLIRQLETLQPELAGKVRQLENLVDHTFDDTHRITADLRPNVLELGIVTALEWQARQFEERIGIPFTFRCGEDQIELDMDRAIVLFRICQEATSNIVKYAQADSVEITLRRDADAVVLQVADDGIGIRPEDKLKRNAFGLRGMIERVQSVGGSITVERGPVNGTLVLVRLPLPSVV